MRRKTTTSLALAALMLFCLCCRLQAAGQGTEDAPVKIRMTHNDNEVIIALFDNPAARDFLSMLPLTAEFSDFANTEKISYLPRKLQTAGSPTASEIRADFTYYAPWGNLAVFYRGSGTDGRLYSLGRIESGKEYLGGIRGDFQARLERVE